MTTQKPRVPIGLAVYNGEQVLEETVDAFLAQTYTDFELIISDNASTDREVYWNGAGASMSLPFWSLSLDRFRTVLRSGLPLRQKLSLTRSLLRPMRWGRRKPWTELWAALPRARRAAPPWGPRERPRPTRGTSRSGPGGRCPSSG